MMKETIKKRPVGEETGDGAEQPTDARTAAAEHAEKHKEILLAVEAMRRSQLVQEQRVRHILRQQPYFALD